ncbi:MAG TPA: serine/threonine protein kinase, partial [Candidatus Aminicenantes bacterium]|nr:serine/threonine protein kinase [Candidatus Aminicenantes bacterium]
MTPQTDPLAWPEIPGVVLEKELGRGGMAVVYRGVQSRLKRSVAVKVLSPVLLVDPQFSKRFLREAETAAGLNHSNIVSIYDVGSEGQWNYMVMEYLPQNLADQIGKGNMASEKALAIFSAIASALDYAHGKGFIHRDVKPDNILFREDGTPVLCDFGIARAVGSATRLTKTGMS